MSDQPEGQTVETVSGMDKFCGCLSVAVAIVLTLFHLLAASPLLTLNNTSQAVIHGALIVSYFLLTKPMKWKKLSRPVDFLFIIITVIAAYEVIAMRNNNAASANLYSPFQQYISMVFVVVALIVAYRALGPVLPTLSLLFLVYTLIGRYLPGAFATAKVTMTRMGTYLMVSSEGLFGSALCGYLLCGLRQILRRPCPGGGLFLYAHGHGQRLRCRQRGHHRHLYHPSDEEDRLRQGYGRCH